MSTNKIFLLNEHMNRLTTSAQFFGFKNCPSQREILNMLNEKRNVELWDEKYTTTATTTTLRLRLLVSDEGNVTLEHTVFDTGNSDIRAVVAQQPKTYA